jgi:hypothetical protein
MRVIKVEEGPWNVIYTTQILLQILLQQNKKNKYRNKVRPQWFWLSVTLTVVGGKYDTLNLKVFIFGPSHYLQA